MANTERFPLVNNNLHTLRRITGRGVLQDILALRTRDYIYWSDDFLGDALAGRYATKESGSTTAAAVNAGQGGRVVIVTSTNDDSHGALYMPTSTFIGDMDPVISARIKLSAITTVKCEVGFVDAPTTDALSIDNLDAGSNVPTLIGGISDTCVAIFDTDSSQDNWQFAGGDTGTAWRDATLGAAAASGVTHPTPAADTYQWITVVLRRIDLDTDDMDAVFFVDGVEEAYKRGDAIANAASIYPFVTVQSRAGTASRTLTMDAWEIYALRDTSA